MTGYGQALSYLAILLQERAREARNGDTQTGAISLEWVVIAVGLVAIAAVAVAVIKAAVHSEAKSLP